MARRKATSRRGCIGIKMRRRQARRMANVIAVPTRILIIPSRHRANSVFPALRRAMEEWDLPVRIRKVRTAIPPCVINEAKRFSKVPRGVHPRECREWKGSSK